MARTRTFLAVELPAAVREALAGVQRQIPGEVKWVATENLHITLLFLGELDDKDLATTGRLAAKAVKGVESFRISIGGLGAFPNPRRPKVLWAGVTEGADELISLFAKLEESLAEVGLYRREERPFTPHVTLGRLNAGGDLGEAFQQFQEWTAGAVSVEQVVIMASELRRSGSEYTVIGRARLN